MFTETLKTANYPDGTNHELVKTRETRPDVLADPGTGPLDYPKMHGPHTKEHGFMTALRQLMDGQRGPRAKEGYEIATENRDWRYT